MQFKGLEVGADDKAELLGQRGGEKVGGDTKESPKGPWGRTQGDGVKYEKTGTSAWGESRHPGCPRDPKVAKDTENAWTIGVALSLQIAS